MHTDIAACTARLEKWKRLMEKLRPRNFRTASVYAKAAQVYTFLPTGGTVMALSTGLLLYEVRRHHLSKKLGGILAGRMFLSGTLGMLPGVGGILVYLYDANMRNIDQVIREINTVPPTTPVTTPVTTPANSSSYSSFYNLLRQGVYRGSVPY
jgi:hypothetical protein